MVVAAAAAAAAEVAAGTHVLLAADAEGLVDLELDGQAVAVPAEAALDVVAGLVRIPADDVLRRSGGARVRLVRARLAHGRAGGGGGP